MRIKKFVRNYYSKILLICVLAVLLLVSIIVVLIFIQLRTDRKVSNMKKYDNVLIEMVQNYNDIWWDYHKALALIYKEGNEEYFRTFLEDTGLRYDNAKNIRNMERVLEDICRQDERIAGVYLRRISDEKYYVYFRDVGYLTSTYSEWETNGVVEEALRSIIGGRRVIPQILSGGSKNDLEEASLKGSLDIFGIRSQILSLSGVEGDFQITVLYDLSSFDAILRKCNMDSQVRFCVTSAQGVIIYDSWGEYDYNQATYFESMDKITGDGDVFTEKETTYIKKSKDIKQGRYLAFCIVSEDYLEAFQFERTSSLVLVVSFGVIITVVLLVFSINRLIGRKFHELEKGLHQVGKNNLKYRLPVGKQEDEFSRIAVRFNRMCDDLEEMIDKNYVYQMLQRNAEYKALQTSVNPHFLYNALEVLRERLDENGQGNEAEMVLLLSRIFEYQIRGDSIVTIRREWQSLKNYIDFYLIRYQYFFEYDIEFDDEIWNYRIPKHIFQPIVENYFVHGFRNDGTDFIYILGYLDTEEDMIRIRFCDNGKGMSEEQIAKLTASFDEGMDENTHIGLRNVHKRLQIAFGEESCIEIESNAPEPGVSITLVFSAVLEFDKSEFLGGTKLINKN